MAQIISPESGGTAAGPGLSYWLGSKVLNQPLAMQAEAAVQLQAAIEARAFDQKYPAGGAPGLSKFAGSQVRQSAYRVTDDGIALVPVSGLLIDRGAFLGDRYGWMTSYEGLSEQLRRLGKDDAIKQVILDIDSGGGVATGLFDLTEEIRKLAGKKRVSAIAANVAASAAYAIGCAADEIFVTRGGIAGSIGVIVMHMSYQQMLEGRGVEPTIIHAGAHKADGNPYQALTHGARSEMSAGIDDIYDAFVSHVAKARGLDEQQVRDTEARVYRGERAVEAGLADGVKSFDELLVHIRQKRPEKIKRGSEKSNPKPTSRQKGRAQMSDTVETETSHQEAAATPVASVPSVAPAQPAAAAPLQPGEQPAMVSSPVDEKGRIEAIITAEAAQGRGNLANHLAFKTDLSVEDALAALAASSKEQAPGANDNQQSGTAAQLENALERNMAQPGNAAGVKPDAAAGKKPSFVDFAASQPGARKQ